jgi:hypothetical protein
MKPSPESTVGVVPSDWEKRRSLARGIQYKVIAPFTDADGDRHDNGEEWTFEGAWFSKFEDQIDIFVLQPDGSHWRIPLLWEVPDQAKVIEQTYLFLAQT